MPVIKCKKYKVNKKAYHPESKSFNMILGFRQNTRASGLKITVMHLIYFAAPKSF